MSRQADARRSALAFGAKAETFAAWWLMAKGYRIVARRFACRNGEVDLIAARGSTLAFVEVKARPTLDEAAAAIPEWKRRRIRRAAAVWLARRPPYEGLTLRGDAVCLRPWAPPRHILNAFALEGPE